jgi:hypothetical protein
MEIIRTNPADNTTSIDVRNNWNIAYKFLQDKNARNSRLLPEWIITEQYGIVCSILIHEHEGRKNGLVKVKEFSGSFSDLDFIYIKKSFTPVVRYISLEDVICSIGVWKQHSNYIIIKK